MPATVIISPTMRVTQPMSPAKVPASTTRSIDCQIASTMPRSLPASPFTPVRRNRVSTSAVTTMIASVSRPSQPITTDGPRDRARSNR